MKPWIKICIIFNSVYLVVSSITYALSDKKAAVFGIMLIGLAFNYIIFLKFRKHPERVPEKGEIVRIKNPFQEIFEKIKNKMEVKK